MQLYNTNLRKTTREHHRSTRSYYIQPRGAERITITRPMPTENFVPKLWM